ncbi:glycoside hydrolase family 19 protein [Litchfieldella xinjiangensis]|uniref:glycoside hydrolase family 19 protein n=1 Tax=Litchfieldella xinjiangensis TaxID=1166948 RepID=UPI000693D3DB|nr:glycoside hydrolase family 19 protein [Halomonas xinjiangensis]
MHWLDEIDAVRPAVSPELLRVAMPRCPDVAEWADELSEALAWAKIRVPAEVAMFLAQIGHESSDLTRLEESLWYSADRLMVVWPSRFTTKSIANRFEGNPEALANEVYGGRMGNTQPGDGWRFIGRGPIQLTGRDNYTRCAEATGLPLTEHPERLASCPRHGAMAAAWYWLDRVTPGADIITVTQQVNGGRHGLNDRKRRYERTLRHVQSLGAQCPEAG